MKQFINLIDYLEVIIMTNRELLEFTLKVNIGTCNEIYTKINRQLDEKSDIDLALVRYFNTLVSINHKVQDVLYKERENLNIPNPKHLAFTKDDEIIEIEVQE
jgi:hypothetical protein